MLIDIVAGEKNFGQKRAQLARSCTGRRHPSQLHDDLIAIIQVIQLLRVVTNLHFGAPLNLTRKRRDFRENRFEKSRLARSVGADNSQAFTTAQDKRDISSKELVWIAYRRM